MEQWKDILGFEGLYEVSSMGELRNKATKKILKPVITHCGYYRFRIIKNEERFNKMLHRLVCEAFIENPEQKRTINHKDGNKLNNNIENLEWNTHSENIHHAIKLGLFHINRDPFNRHHSCLSEEQVLEIDRMIKSKEHTYKQIALMFGVHPSRIEKIKARTTWKHLFEKIG